MLFLRTALLGVSVANHFEERGFSDPAPASVLCASLGALRSIRDTDPPFVDPATGGPPFPNRPRVFLSISPLRYRRSVPEPQFSPFCFYALPPYR